ncbi:unnamed protein product [Camellia sinensis]
MKVGGSSYELRINAEEYGNDWLYSSAVGKMRVGYSIEDLRLEIQNRGMKEPTVREGGGRMVYITFNSEDDMKTKVQEMSEWIYDWCEMFTSWEKGMRMDNERLVWLNCYGVPHSLWNSKTYQKLGELWGELVVLDENITNMVSLNCGRIQICTSQLEKIDHMVLPECRGNSYPIRVVEDNNHGVGTLPAQHISQKKFSEKNSVGYNNGDDQSVVQCYGNKEDDDVVACTKAVVDTCNELAKMERIAFYTNRAERINQLFLQLDIITGGIDEVSSNTKPLIRQMRKLSKSVKKLMEMIPHQECSPVLGYLTAAEFGVVFLMFNIGLELSVERLSSVKKYVFGLGSAQVLVTAVVIGLVSRFIAGQPSPAAIVIGNGLALSSTAVVLQVLQERGESTSRHERATFSVLLFQDTIAEALGLAAVKAIVAITAIIAGGRLLLWPIYKQVEENQNNEIFSANTLLVILGTSLLTAWVRWPFHGIGSIFHWFASCRNGISLQVESDIAPYRGLILGLFFMTMSSLLFLVVGVSTALTPWLAAGGQLLASRFDDVWSLLPVESEKDMIIAQLLSERLVPFVALDVRSFSCIPGHPVLLKVGAERACAAAITLDTPGANYRTVWELSKYLPNVKTFVHAHDVDHGLHLEKAGATALSEASGSALGYGYSWIMSKPRSQPSDSSDDNQITEGTLVPSPKDKD